MLMCSVNMSESNLKVICYLWFGYTLISLTSCIVTILNSAHGYRFIKPATSRSSPTPVCEVWIEMFRLFDLGVC